MGRTGKSREVPLLLLWGRKDDISGIKARGAFAEMGGNDSGMQKQRPVREEVVRRKRDFSDDILPMGTCGAEQSARCNAEARNTGFCRAASAETGVAERVGMFRHRADRGWVYRVSSRNESGTDQKPDKGAAVMLNDFSGADKVYIVWARHCITCWSSGHTYFAIWKTAGWSSATTVRNAASSRL